MNKILKNKILDNIKTIFYALLIAIFIRSLFFQPFYIPSSSMEPTLLIGDRIFVTKYEYGYNKHSFPFSPPLLKQRILSRQPNYGDLVVFKYPVDNRTDYIKRLIGMPGDTIQFINGKLFLNNNEVKRSKINNNYKIRCGSLRPEVNSYEETLPNGKKYIAVYYKEGSQINSDKYKVPDKHYFFLGDNRDCSRDSRFLSSVGYVSNENLVGKAKIIFFSHDTVKGSLLKFWNWKNSFRLQRTLKFL